MRTRYLVPFAVADAATVPYETVGVSTVTWASGDEIVPVTFGADAPPLLRTGIVRSIVSPASQKPSPLPSVPPAASSSIVSGCSVTSAAAEATTLIVAWYGRQLNDVTV